MQHLIKCSYKNICMTGALTKWHNKYDAFTIEMSPMWGEDRTRHIQGHQKGKLLMSTWPEIWAHWCGVLSIFKDTLMTCCCCQTFFPFLSCNKVSSSQKQSPVLPGSRQGWSPGVSSSGCKGCFLTRHRCTRCVRGHRSVCRKLHLCPVHRDHTPPASPWPVRSASAVQNKRWK